MKLAVVIAIAASVLSLSLARNINQYNRLLNLVSKRSNIATATDFVNLEGKIKTYGGSISTTASILVNLPALYIYQTADEIHDCFADINSNIIKTLLGVISFTKPVVNVVDPVVSTVFNSIKNLLAKVEATVKKAVGIETVSEKLDNYCAKAKTGLCVLHQMVEVSKKKNKNLAGASSSFLADITDHMDTVADNCAIKTYNALDGLVKAMGSGLKECRKLQDKLDPLDEVSDQINSLMKKKFCTPKINIGFKKIRKCISVAGLFKSFSKIFKKAVNKLKDLFKKQFNALADKLEPLFKVFMPSEALVKQLASIVDKLPHLPDVPHTSLVSTVLGADITDVRDEIVSVINLIDSDCIKQTIPAYHAAEFTPNAAAALKEMNDKCFIK